MDRSRFRYGSDNRRDWVDWLSDNPPPPAAKQALRQARVQAAASYQSRTPQPEAAGSPAGPANPDLTININLQKIRLPKPKLPKVVWSQLLPSKRIGLAVFVVVMASGAYFFVAGGRQNDTGAGDSAQNVRTTPSFKPVAPATEPQLGKFAGRVTAYDGRRDIYSYADSLAGNRITISEQNTPQNLGSADQALQKVAAQVGAAAKINTKNGPAYIKTDKETGAQVIVCSAGGLLLFINSSTSFQNADWIKYIDNLE